jgi:hypothetical protein
MSFRERMERDLDVFFNTKEFGEKVLLLSRSGDPLKEVPGIFDEIYEDLQIEENQLPGTKTLLSVKSRDLGDFPYNGLVNVRGTRYQVLEKRPDGTGVTILILGEL